MSDLEEAFLETVDAQNEVRGKEIKITIGATANIPCLEWPILANDILVDGAMAESGGFRNQFLCSAVTAVPKQLDAITASDGTQLQIYSVNRINETYQTEAFSPVGGGKRHDS